MLCLWFWSLLHVFHWRTCCTHVSALYQHYPVVVLQPFWTLTLRAVFCFYFFWVTNNFTSDNSVLYGNQNMPPSASPLEPHTFNLCWLWIQKFTAFYCCVFSNLQKMAFLKSKLSFSSYINHQQDRLDLHACVQIKQVFWYAPCYHLLKVPLAALAFLVPHYIFICYMGNSLVQEMQLSLVDGFITCSRMF